MDISLSDSGDNRFGIEYLTIKTYNYGAHDHRISLQKRAGTTANISLCDEIMPAKVDYTIVGGKVVYKRKGAN